jgi:cytochrome P450
MSTEEMTFSYDPYSPAVMADPYPFYAELRREHPVFYLPKYDGYFLSRFDDILEFLSYVDNSFLLSEGPLPPPAQLRRKNDGAPPPPPEEPFPRGQRLGMPVHGQIRRSNIKPLMPRSIGALSDFVRDLANARLDILLPKGRFNLTRDYGGVVSSMVMMHLMGMPLELAERSLDIINSGTRTDPEIGGFDSMAVAMEAIQFYLPFVQARADAGADGSVPLVDGLFDYRYNGRPLTIAEIAQQLVCAFIGGIETVPKIVAHGLMELSDHPDQLAAVRADLETNVPRAAGEMIRFCAPAQWFMRTAHKRVTIAGQVIEPGQRVFYLVASALRDEREFDEPEAFRWDRAIPRTLAFGHGVHYCIGVHLAPMEIKVMVDTFLRRVPKYSFDMQAAERPPSSFQRGWNKLPVIIG